MNMQTFLLSQKSYFAAAPDKYIDDPGDNFGPRDKSSGNMTVLSLMRPAEGPCPDLYVALEYSQKREKWTLNSWFKRRGNQPAGGRRENLNHDTLKEEAMRLGTWLKTLT
jgi:hypothetical protein